MRNTGVGATALPYARAITIARYLDNPQFQRLDKTRRPFVVLLLLLLLLLLL